MTEPVQSSRLYTFCRNSLLVFLKLVNRLSVEGSENVPSSGGVLLVANHASFLDPPVLGCAAMHRHVRFMARDTLFHNRWFGRLLHGVRAVPISRERGDVSALKKALSVLRAGDCLGFFPEGTRSSDGALQPVKPGVGFIAAKSGVPVVPAYIVGSFEAFSRHHRWIRPRKIRIIVGTPIERAEFEQFSSDANYYDKIGELIMARIQALAPRQLQPRV